MEPVMSPLFTAILAITLSSQAPKEFFIVRIVIYGSTATPDGVILEFLQLYPAQKMTVVGLVAADKRLRSLGIFRCNPWRGIGPSVTAQAVDRSGKDVFFDILVTIEDRPINGYAFWASRNLVRYEILRTLTQSHTSGVLGVVLTPDD